jgi:serine/threonine-protein phosphatase 2A regulatory subunit A
MVDGSPEDLYQIALLIDQLKHDDAQIRVTASKNLVPIAKALGAERTRNELIPFLTESLDDEDEVLEVLAAQLKNLVPLLGGAEHTQVLLKPLETLIMVEENAVREAALISIEAVLDNMTSDQLAEQYVPLLSRLAINDWFTSRMSSAALFHIGYKKLADPQKQKCRALFLKLCNDETPMVRRTAAIFYGQMAKIVKPHELQAEFMAPLASLSEDEQDSVRIQVIPMCIALAEILPLEAKMSQVLPVLLNLANDRSWRVRWALASRIPEVCGALGPQLSNNSLSSAYEALLNDTEAEVRSAAAASLVLVCGTLRKDVILNQILPAAARLAGDVSEHVRASLALVINGIAAIVGRDGSVEHVLPVLLLLLRDEVSDVSY